MSSRVSAENKARHLGLRASGGLEESNEDIEPQSRTLRWIKSQRNNEGDAAESGANDQPCGRHVGIVRGGTASS